MYEYKIKLPYKVECCEQCPFRHEELFLENLVSTDKLSGVINITRRQSACSLKSQPVLFNEFVDTYGSSCPLRGQGLYIEDEKK